YTLIGGKARSTLETFPSPPDGLSLIEISGVNDFGFWVTTTGTSHDDPYIVYLKRIIAQYSGESIGKEEKFPYFGA
ncbi:hypothetical protein HKBW3C_03179, partial [Candidatus Hakubella thermalkaliphila]